MSSRVISSNYSSRLDAVRDLIERISRANFDDDSVFQDFFQESIRFLELSELEASDGLKVSRPTVNRWINGASAPTRALRGPVFGWITKELRRRVARLGGNRRKAIVDNADADERSGTAIPLAAKSR